MPPNNSLQRTVKTVTHPRRARALSPRPAFWQSVLAADVPTEWRPDVKPASCPMAVPPGATEGVDLLRVFRMMGGYALLRIPPHLMQPP
jgi:hypothetical protein